MKVSVLCISHVSRVASRLPLVPLPFRGEGRGRGLEPNPHISPREVLQRLEDGGDALAAADAE
jgi:hypothetical protein